jgi:hypothetical protein
VQDHAKVSFWMETSSDVLTPRPALKTSWDFVSPFSVGHSGLRTFVLGNRPPRKRGGSGNSCRWQVVRYMQTPMQRIGENLEQRRRGQGMPESPNS